MLVEYPLSGRKNIESCVKNMRLLHHKGKDYVLFEIKECNIETEDRKGISQKHRRCIDGTITLQHYNKESKKHQKNIYDVCNEAGTLVCAKEIKKSKEFYPIKAELTKKGNVIVEGTCKINNREILADENGVHLLVTNIK